MVSISNPAYPGSQRSRAGLDCQHDGRQGSVGALAALRRGLMLRLLRVDVERRLRVARN